MTLMKRRIKDLFKYRDLVRELVSRDIKLKYRRSVLGYLWSVMDPLLTMLVMAFVFSNMFDRGVENYPVYLISGQLSFNFMKTATTKCVHSITGNSSLIKKVYLPKYIFPLSTVTSCLVDMTFSLVALFGVMIFTGAPFTWKLPLLIVPALEVYAFSIGLGLILAALQVFFRDIQFIYGVFTTVWMYLTPLFYTLENVTPLHRAVSSLNPMYHYITQFRDVAMQGMFPDSWNVLYGGCAALVFIALGTFIFARLQDKFILYI